MPRLAMMVVWMTQPLLCLMKGKASTIRVIVAKEGVAATRSDETKEEEKEMSEFPQVEWLPSEKPSTKRCAKEPRGRRWNHDGEGQAWKCWLVPLSEWNCLVEEE